MKCPVCPDATLVMAERTGIEIDYCPQCRGVWLDRGELDKIIGRSLQEYPGQSAPHAQQAPHQQQEYRPESHPSSHADPRDYGFGHGERRQHSHDDHPTRGHGGHSPHKKKSILGELFDF